MNTVQTAGSTQDSKDQCKWEVPIDYTIDSCSSHSATYRPENIKNNEPTNQGSRWSSGSNNQAQYLTLKLQDLAVVKSITFGKYHKVHVCNSKEFKIYAGLEPDKIDKLVLHAGLRNDTEPETFQLKHLFQESIVSDSSALCYSLLTYHRRSHPST